ncbi:lysophosphatidylserine lipase ABHD12-like [Tigriopus californicus]|uniref:lysophosphatidylserine lipase ABHD12-like n=1 Tax=Tigriopus californicus TaxID=6832 RepID=UPI0027DA6F81|nr:lysophosphatidylserine lipase ABHD12-like [Tigriopus californicus]
MTDEVKTFKVSKMVAFFLDVTKTIQDAQVEFDSSKWIKAIREPITILHSVKDCMVPIKLGRALYEEAKTCCDVDFVEYNPDIYKIGHDYFIRDPDLVVKLRALIQRIDT